mmetsp:Transcript_36362/g.104735  ORF Transcript_36362/g.104735 Transcript_36362/m.104735 type:complete len:276 (-) Transcript_36362:861-1688(-)
MLHMPLLQMQTPLQACTGPAHKQQSKEGLRSAAAPSPTAARAAARHRPAHRRVPGRRRKDLTATDGALHPTAAWCRARQPPARRLHNARVGPHLPKSPPLTASRATLVCRLLTPHILLPARRPARQLPMECRPPMVCRPFRACRPPTIRRPATARRPLTARSLPMASRLPTAPKPSKPTMAPKRPMAPNPPMPLKLPMSRKPPIARSPRKASRAPMAHSHPRMRNLLTEQRPPSPPPSLAFEASRLFGSVTQCNAERTHEQRWHPRAHSLPVRHV